MPKIAIHNRAVMLAVTTALASTALSGCTTTSAAPAGISAAKTQASLAQGNATKAITHAEATVLADPRNPEYRAMLGGVYMEAGRFYSAAQTFGDAMELGDTSARTALSYALAQIAAGQADIALSVLNEYRSVIDAPDMGLALSLAGRPEQGVHVLSNALRGGQSTPKVRQNLAYSYALMGDWRSARLMAAEDVPADQLGLRMSEWAHTASPEYYQARIAALLEVPLVADSGQPAMLALSNNPTMEQMAAAAIAEPAQMGGELPATDTLSAASPAARPIPSEITAAIASAAPESVVFATTQQTQAPKLFEDAFSAPIASSARDSATKASDPVARAVAQNRIAPATVSAPSIAATGNHLVQLGSFTTEKSAERAWSIYTKRYPQLSRYEMVITKARVRGKTYYRVSAGGFQRASAAAMCSTVKADNHGCFAWAANAPMPGALDRSTRMASR